MQYLLHLGWVPFASQVDGQDVPTNPVARSSASGASTAPESAAVVNRKLRERVRADLHAEPYLYARHIDIAVRRHAVVLSGVVFSDWELQDALRVAREVSGNRQVIDHLSLDRDYRR
jgi:osmotically-inducible protein OsmY